MSGKHRFATEEIEKFSTLDLISELKRRYQVLSRPERSCVLLGPPYSGVSTQSSFLRKEWGMCTLKRDDIVKADQDLNTSLNRLSEELGSFRCRRGFVLTNFPESENEAKGLDQIISAKHPSRKDYSVILMSVPSTPESQEIITQRATGMLVHEQSGRLYNGNVPELAPQTKNMDDVTGEALVCPKWDLSGLKDRLNTWWRNTEKEVSAYYGDRVQRVNAQASRDTVSVEISKILLNSKEESLAPAPDAYIEPVIVE